MTSLLLGDHSAAPTTCHAVLCRGWRRSRALCSLSRTRALTVTLLLSAAVACPLTLAAPALADPSRAFQLVTNAASPTPYDVFPPASNANPIPTPPDNTPYLSFATAGLVSDLADLYGFRAVSPDGSHVIFTASANLAGDTPDGGGADNLGYGGPDVYAAIHGPSGWTTKWMSFAGDRPAGAFAQQAYLQGVSQSGGTVLYSPAVMGSIFSAPDPNSIDPRDPGATLTRTGEDARRPGIPNNYDVYRSDGVADTELAGPLAPPSESLLNPDLAGGLSADGATAVWSSYEAILPGQPDVGVKNLYEQRNGMVSQVSVASNGSSPENGDSYLGNDADPEETPSFTLSQAGKRGRDQHAISLDGSRIVFSSTEQLAPGAPADGSTSIYLREGGQTRLIAGGSTSSNTFVYYEDATPDVSHVYFVRSAGTAASPSQPGELYDYNVATGNTSLVSADQSGNPSSDPNQTAGYVTSSADGSHVYFVSEAPLDPSHPQANWGLYERVSGNTTKFIASLPELSGFGSNLQSDYTCSEHYVSGKFSSIGQAFGACPVPVYTARASTDGGHLYFASAGALTPDNTDQRLKVYHYNDVTGQITLVSKGPSSGNAPYDAYFAMPQSTLSDIWVPSLGISSDGSTAFFQTREKLTPDAADNGKMKVYESQNGVTTLVSPGAEGGSGPGDAVYDGNSADGSDVFFTTADAVTCTDSSPGHWRIFDARVGGAPDSCPSQPPPAARPLVSPLLGEAPATQAPAASGNVSLLINRLGAATVKKPATCRAKANKIKSTRKRAQALKRCRKPKPKKPKRRPKRSRKGRR
jgi:WD40-like Beta Propeller Repeat